MLVDGLCTLDDFLEEEGALIQNFRIFLYHRDDDNSDEAYLAFLKSLVLMRFGEIRTRYQVEYQDIETDKQGI